MRASTMYKFAIVIIAAALLLPGCTLAEAFATDLSSIFGTDGSRDYDASSTALMYVDDNPRYFDNLSPEDRFGICWHALFSTMKWASNDSDEDPYLNAIQGLGWGLDVVDSGYSEPRVDAWGEYHPGYSWRHYELVGRDNVFAVARIATEAIHDQEDYETRAKWLEDFVIQIKGTNKNSRYALNSYLDELDQVVRQWFQEDISFAISYTQTIEDGVYLVQATDAIRYASGVTEVMII